MQDNPSVLIVDDNPASIDFMVELLKYYDVSAVTSVREAREAMEKELPDLILLDISMPEVDGFTFCNELKADPKKQDIPIIFLTASSDSEDIRHALSIGGADYITKPYQAEIVSKRIEIQLELIQLRRRLRKAELLDGLSGTKKKEIFNVKAKRWFDYAVTEEKPVSLCAVSIGNLKEINLQFGIETADDVIKSVSHILVSVSKKNMLLTRFGGGLFILLVYGITSKQFAPSLEAIKKAVAGIKIATHPDLAVKPCTALSDSLEVPNYDRLLKTVLQRNSDIGCA